jgi:hypothetical protein
VNWQQAQQRDWDFRSFIMQAINNLNLTSLLDTLVSLSARSSSVA